MSRAHDSEIDSVASCGMTAKELLGKLLFTARCVQRSHSRPSRLTAIVENTGWLLSEQALLMPLGMAMSVWMARYLGPDDYGLYHYAVSFVGLFGFFTYLGLAGIVTRDLVQAPEDKEEILGTAFYLKLLGALPALVVILVVAFNMSLGSTVQWMIALIGTSIVFDAFGVISLWYESRVQSKLSVMGRLASATTGFILRAALIMTKAPVLWFALALLIERGASAIGLCITYRWGQQSLRRWRWNLARAKQLMGQSWPLILASAGSLIYLKIDRIMLGQMISAREVGIYSVAASLSEVWYFIPITIASSLFPSIVESTHMEKEVYHRRLQAMFSIVAWLGVAVAAVVMLASSPVLHLLYGSEYEGTSSVLKIHIWASPAVFMGAILSRWLVAENLLVFSFTRHVLAAVLNVVLNFILIPTHGAVGAAIATVVSYTFANYLACFTDSRTRIAGRLMTYGLFNPIGNAKFLVRYISQK